MPAEQSPSDQVRTIAERIAPLFGTSDDDAAVRLLVKVFGPLAERLAQVEAENRRLRAACEAAEAHYAVMCEVMFKECPPPQALPVLELLAPLSLANRPTARHNQSVRNHPSQPQAPVVPVPWACGVYALTKLPHAVQLAIMENAYSTAEAANKLHVTTGRIRQLCREFKLDRKGRDWLIFDSTLRIFSTKIRKRTAIAVDTVTASDNNHPSS